MTRKEKLLEDIQFAIDCKVHRFWVKIETAGSEGLEIIINPLCNLKAKKEYYSKAYNDDLVLNSYSGIRIVNWGYFNKNEELNYYKDIICGNRNGEDIYHV